MTFWVFLNRSHKYAKVHRADCIFCDQGRGLHHRGTASAASSWLGPFGSFREAMDTAVATGREASTCSNCTPA